MKSNPACDIGVINTDKNPAYGQAIKMFKKGQFNIWMYGARFFNYLCINRCTTS
ncbi:hypothetical protein LDG_5887 [Legionella drancourtii LLAP12]|uniref:Uncharacterized protein n=1 Tax=Legionella drancourtii LLAP12 TaxID=658187 RepID=G9EKZ3_9GAMM|nr:hypothetical protein LDG_5887 [Legionella drancourtii LLAP12]